MSLYCKCGMQPKGMCTKSCVRRQVLEDLIYSTSVNARVNRTRQQVEAFRKQRKMKPVYAPTYWDAVMKMANALNTIGKSLRETLYSKYYTDGKQS